eukprot:TRINITY_DN3237_c0_g7_i1.p1 TRINITY_DN3237_c0_g7~~TRINITY_DN3237_c0_g7_i1.p1  ORF type:complete len:181 (+),score=47.69 TRINITY_DN3237_c0_g7_i1:139-681(+)
MVEDPSKKKNISEFVCYFILISSVKDTESFFEKINTFLDLLQDNKEETDDSYISFSNVITEALRQKDYHLFFSEFKRFTVSDLPKLLISIYHLQDLRLSAFEIVFSCFRGPMEIDVFRDLFLFGSLFDVRGLLEFNQVSVCEKSLKIDGKASVDNHKSPLTDCSVLDRTEIIKKFGLMLK